MAEIYLNRIAIWLPVAKDDIDIRKMPVGVSYLTKDSLVFKHATFPLIRVVKNYVVKKNKEEIKFSLFLRTDREDIDKLEEELDNYSKEITFEYAKSALNGATFEKFNYTDFYIKEKENI